MPNRSREKDDDQQDTRTLALIGLAVVLALAIIAVILVRALRTESQREDCLMAGRRNCVQIELPPRR